MIPKLQTMTLLKVLFLFTLLFSSGNFLYGQNLREVNGKYAAFHVLWPIPSLVITANTQGVINQNAGYNGAEKNIPPLTTIE